MSVNFGVEEKTDYIGFVYQFREKMEKGIRARKHVQYPTFGVEEKTVLRIERRDK